MSCLYWNMPGKSLVECMRLEVPDVKGHVAILIVLPAEALFVEFLYTPFAPSPDFTLLSAPDLYQRPPLCTYRRIFVSLQDHIVAAALLTSRDTFLTRSEYAHLVYAGCGPLRTVAQPSRAVDGRLLCVDKVYAEADVALLPPALLHPAQLWTGKQVVGPHSQHLPQLGRCSACSAVRYVHHLTIRLASPIQ